MSNKISELSQKRNRLIADAQILVNEGKASTEEYRGMVAEIDTLQSDIDAIQKIERLLPNLPPPVQVPVATSQASSNTSESRELRRAKLNAAWRAHFQGKTDNRIPEHRDILTTDANGGGAVVPQEFSGFLSQTLKWFAPLTTFANTRISPNGRAVKVGRVSDTANGLTIITEGNSTPVPEVDPVFSSSVLSTDLFSSGVIRFANELVQDSYFDLEKVLTNLSSIRVGRGLETLLTKGVDSSGTATPNNPGLVNIAQTATTTSTLAAGLGWRDILNTFNALDIDYLPRAVWQMSAQTRNYLASLEDGMGRPYFVPAPTQDGFDMLLGKPIVINNSLPLYSVPSAKPVIFGSLFDGFQIVSSEVRVQILRERYAEFNESAIIVSVRTGSASLQVNALQALVTAAS
jgi:HK97 family phage major capsid protein